MTTAFDKACEIKRPPESGLAEASQRDEAFTKIFNNFNFEIHLKYFNYTNATERYSIRINCK